MLTGTYMMVHGKMTRLTGMESTRTWTAPGTKGSGRRTSSTGRALRHGLMVPHMRATTLMGRSMGAASSHGPTGALIMGSFMRITLKARGFINGQMAESMMEIGKTTRWRDMGSLPGPTVADMKENTWMIKKKARAHSSGLMVANTTVIGKMGSSMGSASTRVLPEKPNVESGMRARESLGLTDVRFYLTI